MTNGEVREDMLSIAETYSESIIVVMFNLERLNVAKPEVIQGHAWERGMIPESPDFFIETFVQRVDQGRFHFEVGTS